MFKRLSKKKKVLGLFLFFVFIIVVFFVSKPALAKEGEAVASILGWILLPIISLIGKLITVMIRLLVWVAQYNDFIASPAVSKGWIIIRDIFNMFFIFILLIIAFGTVLKAEKYSYKRLLGGFLLAAILVNFSKLICGIFIDVAQIIMLTFVNAFKAVGEGNLAELLGLRTLMDLRQTGEGNLNKELIGALCLGFIMSAIALVVVTIITLIFVFRIIILWFLVLLSPLAFMGSALPSLQRYANQWWEKFASQVIIGPVLAFFLWLSFAMVQEPALKEGGIYKSVVPSGTSVEETITGELITTTEETQPLSAAVSEAGKPQYVLNFIIGIGMLLGSLMVAQQLGVAGGKMAGNALAKIQAIGAGAAKAPFKAVGKTAKFFGKEGIRELEATTGIPLTKERWKAISEERKRRLATKREEEGAKRRRRGVLSYLPKGRDEWAKILTLKEGPRALGRFTQGIFGKAKRDREEAAKLIGEREKIGMELKSKISETKYKGIKKNIEEKEDEHNRIKLNAGDFKAFGTMNLNNVDEYLKVLEQKINQWREKKDPKAEQASNLAENLKQLFDQAKEDGKDSIDFNKVSPEVNKSFYKENVSEWFVQKTKSTEDDMKSLKEQQEKYDFIENDQKETNKELQGLREEIDKLNIDDEAKNELLGNIKDLSADISQPFGNLTLEKRKAMADKTWQVQQKIKELREDEKINESQADSLLDQTKAAHLRLNKEVVTDTKMEDINEKQKKRKQDIHNLQARAEMIQPRTMTPEQKQAINREVMVESEKLKDIADPQELITLYHRAEMEKDTALARAVLMKLSSQYDMNEILGDLNYEQGFRGEAKLAKRLHEKVGMDEQESYIFINDLAYKNKALQAFRFMAPLVRDQKTGLYRPTTDEEEEKIALTESGKMDPENFYRRGWWGEMFCKEIDPQTGERIPIADRTTIAIIKRDIDMIHKEMCKGFRFQKELERDMAHPRIVQAMEKMIILRKEDQEKVNEILKSLKSKQKDFWG